MSSKVTTIAEVSELTPKFLRDLRAPYLLTKKRQGRCRLCGRRIDADEAVQLLARDHFAANALHVEAFGPGKIMQLFENEIGVV